MVNNLSCIGSGRMQLNDEKAHLLETGSLYKVYSKHPTNGVA